MILRSLASTLAVAALSVSAMAEGSLKGYHEIQQARIQFGKAKLDSAVELYSKVPKGSEYWLEALEEQSQAYGREGRFDKAMANLKTVLAPQFEGLIGPEPYFVMALTQLKVCDYSGALKTIKEFKNAMKPRVESLERVQNSEIAPEIMKVHGRAHEAKELEFTHLGPEAKKLPRNLHRDAAANKLAKSSAVAFAGRVQSLAKAELNEIDKVISKMQIVESEVIQKVNLLVHDKNRSKVGKFAKAKDELVFPGDEEVWFDELGHFSAEVEKCPTLKQRVSL